MPLSKILELYARSGRSLIDNGLSEAVLPVAVADAALELFSQQRWRVLGGDVYHLTAEGMFEPTYENWFYEGKSVEESIGIAHNFIDRLTGQSMFVVFVIKDHE
jgi:hypothetical protein